MRFFESFWIHGFMPLQFFLLLGFTFIALVICQFLLKRIGLGVPVFGHIVLFWLSGYLILKYVVYPPLPKSMLYNYMGIITVALFLLVSSSEETWKAFKRPILGTMRAETGKYWVSRIVVFTLLPLFVLK